MAKRPKRMTPLRHVRQCSGLSQKKFANLVGINLHLYHSLELGRARLTEENAYRIFDHTGAAPSTLDHRHSKIARAVDGPYSETSWNAWQKYLRKEYLHWPQTKHLVDWTHFLCDIARKQGRLRVLQRALARALRTIAADCGLEQAIQEELKDKVSKTNFRATYGTLRNNKSLAKTVNFEDRSHKSGEPIADDAVWEGVVKCSLRWDPFGHCPVELTKRLKPL